MKIAFLIRHMRDNGSIPSLTDVEASHFVKNHDVTVISIFKNNLTKPHKYNIYDIDVKNDRLLPIRSFCKIVKYLNKNKIDVLIMQHTSCYYSLIKHFTKTKLIWVDHGSLWWRHRIIEGKMNTLWREKIIVKNSTKIVSLTSDNKNAYLEFFPKFIDKVEIIPNFVSVVLPTGGGYNFNSKSIVTVGRCDEGKDYFTTIRCFSRAIENNTDWKLFIYADGPLFNDLNNYISKLKMDKSIFIIRNEIPLNIYQNKSFFIFNSWHEGFGLVLLEAISSKLPVISYDCHSGPSDLVLNKVNGFLVKLGDEKEYINKIKYLINNKEERIIMSANSFNHSKKFAKEKILSLWDDLLANF